MSKTVNLDHHWQIWTQGFHFTFFISFFVQNKFVLISSPFGFTTKFATKLFQAQNFGLFIGSSVVFQSIYCWRVDLMLCGGLTHVLIGKFPKRLLELHVAVRVA